MPVVWSYAHHRLLARCERALWWTLWGAEDVGLTTADRAARTAQRARRMRHRLSLSRAIDTAIRRVARETVSAVLEGHERPGFDALLAAARRTLDDECWSSRPDLIAQFWRLAPSAGFPTIVNPRGPWRLRDSRFDEEHSRLMRCLGHLAGATAVNDVAQIHPDEIVVGMNSSEAFGFAVRSLLTEHRVSVVIDVAYRHHDVAAVSHLVSAPTWCVVDIQAGSPSDDDTIEPLRLGVATLWLEASGRTATDGVYLGRVVDLWRGVDRWFTLGPRARDGVRHIIDADMARLRRRMTDCGTPGAKRLWALTGAPYSCGGCAYHELCRAELRRLHRDEVQP